MGISPDHWVSVGLSGRWLCHCPNGRAQTGARFYEALRDTGLSRYRIELLDEDQPSAESTIQAYQRLLSGESKPSDLLEDVTALEKLGVTEGTLRS